MNETLPGKVIRRGMLGNSPHKFVWYNRTHEEFEALTGGKRIGPAGVRGRWLTLDLDPGYRLVLGECGGKVLFQSPSAAQPKKYHLFLSFEDGSGLTILTTLWGAMELYEAGRELDRQYIKGMRPTPVDPAFTFDYFTGLVNELLQGGKRSVKSLLTQDQLIPGLGNAIAQDILFRSRLHPRHSLSDLTTGHRHDLFSSIQETTREVIENGGRYDETDLFGRPGGYIRLMDGQSVGKPCPVCGRTVEKLSYLGGTCYFCSGCQG
jgi:formamidopyrimidine-DNA glycosylase